MSWRPWYALLLLFATIVSFGCGLLIGPKYRNTPPHVSDRRVRGQPRRAVCFQIFRFSQYPDARSDGADRRRLQRAESRSHPAGRDFLPHVSGSQLSVSMCIAVTSRRSAISAYLRSTSSIIRSLSPGRSSARSHFLPQLRLLRTPDPKLAYDESRAVDGLRLVLRGFREENHRRGQSGAVRRPYLQRSHKCDGRRAVSRNHRIRVSDLFRFFRLHRHRPRLLARHGPGTGPQFPPPYFARSVADFWKRWHISLTSWFRDYVYLPMGGNRVSHGRWIVNVMTVFLLSGLWHGANWTFVVWGALHGGYYIVSRNTALSAGSDRLVKSAFRTIRPFTPAGRSWRRSASSALRGYFSAPPMFRPR